jgi:cytochrome c oxidase subunit 1
MMVIGLFIAGFGALYHPDADKSWSLPVLIIGLAITFGSMIVRSLKDDLGYHISKEELMNEKGGNK